MCDPHAQPSRHEGLNPAASPQGRRVLHFEGVVSTTAFAYSFAEPVVWEFRRLSELISRVSNDIAEVSSISRGLVASAIFNCTPSVRAAPKTILLTGRIAQKSDRFLRLVLPFETVGGPLWKQLGSEQVIP